METMAPGLPKDIAALVTHVSAGELTVQLVNLSTTQARVVVLQAGAFGEHRFDQVAYNERISDYPGHQNAYAAPALESAQKTKVIDATRFTANVPEGCEITLRISMTRYVNAPSY